MIRKTIRVGYQGDTGSNSNRAAVSLMRNEKWVLYPLVSSENVVSALKEKKIDYGVLAIRKSSAGMVGETEEALKDVPYIVLDSISLPIHHVLYKKRNDDSVIKKIVSHPQALKQCELYLKKNYPTSLLEEYPDTALAAKDLSFGKMNPGTLVIAGPGLEGMYSLDIVRNNIEDNRDNHTDFILITLN